MVYITIEEKSRENFRCRGEFCAVGVEERIFLKKLGGGGQVKDSRVVRGGMSAGERW